MSRKRNNRDFLKKRKKIGIVANFNNKKIGVPKSYVSLFNEFGNIVIINPLDPNKVRLDLLVLPGGTDINPSRYNAVPDINIGAVDPRLDYFDTVMLPEYLEDTPVFGICRGFQSLLVNFGYELCQSIHTQHPTNPDLNREKLVHHIINPNSLPLIDSYGVVNSMHHQGVYWSDFNEQRKEIIGFGNEIVILAISIDNEKYTKESDHSTATQITSMIEKYSIIESFKLTNNLISVAAVQWHPEEISDDFSKYYIAELLNL